MPSLTLVVRGNDREDLPHQALPACGIEPPGRGGDSVGRWAGDNRVAVLELHILCTTGPDCTANKDPTEYVQRFQTPLFYTVRGDTLVEGGVALRHGYVPDVCEK